MIQQDVLFKVLEALDRLHIPYMLTGSFASSYWGRPRTTHDADLVVEMAHDHVEPLVQALTDEFYVDEEAVREAVDRRSQCNLIHMHTFFKIDLWMRGLDTYERERFRRRRLGDVFGRRVPLTSPEDTIISKLLWYRMSPTLERQFQDALEVYEVQEPYLDQEYLNHWAARLHVGDMLARIRMGAALPPPGP